jgi:hypothetical protein
VAVRQFFLTDEQLWRAIAKNSTEVSNLLDQEVRPVAENGADKDVVRRARLIQFNKLQREYRRRYS